jgi:hypothetical protein
MTGCAGLVVAPTRILAIDVPPELALLLNLSVGRRGRPFVKKIARDGPEPLRNMTRLLRWIFPQGESHARRVLIMTLLMALRYRTMRP